MHHDQYKLLKMITQGKTEGQRRVERKPIVIAVKHKMVDKLKRRIDKLTHVAIDWENFDNLIMNTQ